jgi:hypothetical protein
MRCTSCDTENSERAAFCQLCFAPLATERSMQVAPVLVTAGAGPRRLIETDHDWYVARNQRAAEAVAQGAPAASSLYALAARDAQIRIARGIWWSGGVFTLFAWLAVLRVALFDWGAQGLATRGPGAAIILQAGLIGLVAVAAAAVCAAWVGGDEAWRATLVHSVLWLLAAAGCTALVVFAGMAALQSVSVLAFGIIALTIVVPLGKGSPTRAAPRT